MTIFRSKNPGELIPSVEAETWLPPRLPCGETCLILSCVSSLGCFHSAVTCLCLERPGEEMLREECLLCYLGVCFMLGAQGPVQGLAEARSVNLQPSFQGWEGRCEEAALLRCSENQAVQVQMSNWHCGDPCQR